jgi:hypothetical protein
LVPGKACQERHSGIAIEMIGNCKFLYAVLGTMAALILSGCASQSCTVDQTFTLSTDPNVDASIETGMPCSPPCWQNLVPGKSRHADVLQVLQTAQFVDTGSITSGINSLGDEIISWKSSLTNTQNSMVLDKNGLVSEIGIRLEFRISFQKLIEILGEPSATYAILSPAGNCTLLYCAVCLAQYGIDGPSGDCTRIKKRLSDKAR